MSFQKGNTFVFGETPSASKWDQLWRNDDALADGSGLDDGIILTRHMGFDAVVQVKYAQTNTPNSTTDSYKDTGLVASITPKSTNNYIIIQAVISTYLDNTAGGRSIKFQITRNGSAVSADPIVSAVGSVDGTTNVNSVTPILYKDSPASTSAQEYKIRFAANGAYTVYVNNSNRYSTLLLMEVKPA